MSILAFPRINFSGELSTNPCTCNNDDVEPAFVQRDSDTFGANVSGLDDDQIFDYARQPVTMSYDPGGTKRTYIRLADGRWSGCNLFYFATPASARVAALWREVEDKRKRPLELIGRLGPWTAVRYALGALPLSAALDRLGKLARVRAAAVELPFGQAAIDVDKPADLDLVRRILGSSPGAGA